MTKPCRLPKVSVVIPCYNASATIVATVESALHQTERDIEVIVVDDGSHDSAPWLVRAMSEHDKRVQVLAQSNTGVSSARNAGITAARARVIAFLDADDVWAPEHLTTHLRRLERDPRLGVSFSAARFIDMTGQVIGQSNSKLNGLTPGDLLMGNPTTTCSTLVVRRDVFSDVGLFRTAMRHNEDQEWLFRVMLSGWVLAGDATPRVDYRTSHTGLASDLDGMLRGFETMIAEARKAAPTLVKRNETWARAAMLRYLSRRAIRLGLPQTIARKHIVAALRTEPRMALTHPSATIATLAAAFAPQAIMRPMLRSARTTPAGA
jgi:hypothetical protein